MKKTVKLTILIVSFISVTALSQMYIAKQTKAEKQTSSNKKAAVLSQNDLNGTWYWESANHTNTTELYLVQNGNTVTGTHCSSFFNGSKTDCAEANSTTTISLNRIMTNVYEGSINSTFSDVSIPVRITLNTAAETIEFQQLSQPEQEYYLPNNVTMTLAQD